jgi:purine-binding chemotaxis protein CheW
MGSEIYALDDNFVHEVYSYIEPTKVPCTPSYIIGIINIRGAFISVVDLDIVLGLQKNESIEKGFILLLSNEAMEFGIMVYEIVCEMKIPKNSIQEIPDGLNILTKDLITGVTKEGVIVLDGKRLLEDSKMRVHEEVN